MANTVIDKMIRKSSQTIAILDVNDEQHYDEYHNKRVEHYKTQGLSEDDYWNKYRNLTFMFYHKSYFENIAAKYELNIQISDQENPNNWNSEMRFNVIFRK